MAVKNIEDLAAAGAEADTDLLPLKQAGAAPTKWSLAALWAWVKGKLDADNGTFNPTFTCATPGDLSVTYTTRTGTWRRVGKQISISVQMDFTATFTTASGSIQIGGLPVACANSLDGFVVSTLSAGFTWPGSPAMTQALARATSGQSYLGLFGQKSAGATTAFTISSIVTGVANSIRLSGSYAV